MDGSHLEVFNTEVKMPRFVSALVPVAVFLIAMHVATGGVRADDAKNIATYQQYVAAINRGDTTGALALYTDDAELVGPPPNCLTSCNGKAALRTQLNIEVSVHLQLQLLSSVQVTDGVVTAQVAHRADPITQMGIARVLTMHTVTFRGDKIARLMVEPEMSDQQTATFVASLFAASDVPVVRPPATGDAGLSTETAGDALTTSYESSGRTLRQWLRYLAIAARS